jgi:GxxExxY protein
LQVDEDDDGFLERTLTKTVIGCFYCVYTELGYGFLENVYANALVLELNREGLEVERQPAINVHYRGHLVGEYRADLVIAGRLLIELKAADTLLAAHTAQLLNYLKATRMPLGLLFNFGPRPQFRRLVRSHALRASARSHMRDAAGGRRILDADERGKERG